MKKSSYSLGSSNTEQERLFKQRALYGDTDNVRFKPTDRICEFGCGPLSNFWIPQAVPEGHYVGVDIQPAHIEEGKRRATALGRTNVDLVLSDAGSTNLPSDSFDVGFSRCLLIHLPDPKPVVDELLRLVRPSGRIILIEPHDPTYYVTPNKPCLLKVYRARDRFAYGERRGCPDAALNLYTFLTQLGVNDVSISPHIIYATGKEPERCRSFIKNWLGLIEPVIASLLNQEVVTEQEWRQAREEAGVVSIDTFLYQSMWIAEGVKC